MHFKLKEYLNNNSFYISISIHLAIVLAFWGAFWIDSTKFTTEEMRFNIIEKVVVDKKVKTQVVEVKKSRVIKKKAKRQVFGVSRKSITSSKSIAVKKGNTIAKDPDKKKLLKDDADSLPIPADEFLITSMPVVLEEIRPEYSREAKDLGIEGKVIFEILIDASGNVRDITLIKSLDENLDKAAQIALKKFKFRPAMVDKQKVAVKIKYAINFVLEQ